MKNNAQRVSVRRKPSKCPVCGSIKVATILYGGPVFSEELRIELATGKVVLGGCIIMDTDPVWQCTACGVSLYKSKC